MKGELCKEQADDAPPRKKTRVDRGTSLTNGASSQSPVRTPKKQRGRPPGSEKKQVTTEDGTNGFAKERDSLHRKLKLQTPSKTNATQEHEAQPLALHVDRSARRKSTRKLLDQAADGEASEVSDGEEDLLARKIWEADSTLR